MKRPILGCLAFVVVAALTAVPAHADERQDEADIRAVEARQQNAWNSHNIRAYANLFTSDADIVNVVGWWWKGRSELENQLTAAHKFVFRDSTLTITDVDVRFLTPDIVVVHARWTMRGAKSPNGNPPPTQGIQTQILQRQTGTWLISVFQNTNSVPETPFPTGAPSARPTSGS